MARPKHEFQIIERHPEYGPTLDQLHETLHDWYYKVLVTKEYIKQLSAESEKASA